MEVDKYLRDDTGVDYGGVSLLFGFLVVVFGLVVALSVFENGLNWLLT